MLVGHYAAGFALKSTERKISLGILFIAVQLIDIIWTLLTLAGIEKIEILRHEQAFLALHSINISYSHSIAVSLGCALLAFVIISRLPANKHGLSGKKAAAVVALAILSHLFLDVIVHNKDISIFGMDSPMFGFGLWNYVVAAYALEIGIVIIGLILYLRTTKGKGILGKFGMTAFAALMILYNFASLWTNTMPNTQMIVISSLAIYLTFPIIAFWLDRKRQVVAA